jgi:acetyl/propionyl-CoA carboxylase alpha subunit
VRLYAEDPYHGFAPSPGRIARLRWPEGPGVRVDGGVYVGSEVSVHYDPLLAKLIVWGADREEAVRRLRRALHETRIEGILTSRQLFQALVEDDDFRAGRLDNGMLERKLAAGELGPPAAGEAADVSLIAAAIEHLERTGRTSAQPVASGGRRRWRDAGRRASTGGG